MNIDLTRTQVNLKWRPDVKWKVEPLSETGEDATWTIDLVADHTSELTIFATEQQLIDLAAHVIAELIIAHGRNDFQALRAGLQAWRSQAVAAQQSDQPVEDPDRVVLDENPETAGPK